MIGPWATDGIWLRCGLHTHSTRSDGELAPKDLAGHYARADYDVLAITDHWRITGDDSVDGITVIPSVELNCILPGARDGHVLGYDVGAGEDELHGLAKEHGAERAVGDLRRPGDGMPGGPQRRGVRRRGGWARHGLRHREVRLPCPRRTDAEDDIELVDRVEILALVHALRRDAAARHLPLAALEKVIA